MTEQLPTGDRLTIVHVSSAFSVDFPGGITNYVRTLAASQVQDGHAVYVLDGGALRTWAHHELGFRVRGHDATEVDHFSLKSPMDVEGSTDVMTLIAQVKPNVVHFHLTIGLGTDFYAQFAHAGIPYVISLHDYYLFCPRITMMNYANESCGGPETKKCERCIGALDQVDLLYRGARKVGVELPRLRSREVTKRNTLIAEFFERAHVVLAVAARVAEFYRRAYPNARYQTAHIGNESSLAERLPKEPSPTLRLAAIGTLAKYKGAEVLINLAQRLSGSDIEISFFGRVDAPKWATLATAANIQLRGPYTPDQLPEIMSRTDVGLMLPVWEDNAPQVVMEFLNHGVPVVATDMGGIPDFVNETNGFLFDYRTEDGMQAATSFIRDLNPTSVRAWGRQFPRLTSPAEHQRALQAAYLAAAGG